MPDYLCLNPECGHRWPARTQIPRQCPVCWSYDLISVDSYNEMVGLAVEWNENPGPVLDSLAAILTVQGITMKPLRTLALVNRVIADARQRRISRGVSVVV